MTEMVRLSAHFNRLVHELPNYYPFIRSLEQYLPLYSQLTRAHNPKSVQIPFTLLNGEVD